MARGIKIKLRIYSRFGEFYRRLRGRLTRFWSKYGSTKLLTDVSGSNYIVSSKNALDQLIISKGQIDDGLPYLLCEICNLDSIAIDVGSNAGYYTIPFASNFKEVYSFEPNPSMYPKLLRNIEANHLQNIRPFQIAVGDAVASVNLFIQDSVDGDFNLNSGLSSLKSRPEYHRETIQVQLITIDSLNLRFPIGLIKIDVEGTEFEVIRGARQKIQESRPVILWEASTTISADNYKSCISVLTELNYRNFEIKSNFEISEHELLDEIPTHDFNMLSLPREANINDAIQTKIRGWK